MFTLNELIEIHKILSAVKGFLGNKYSELVPEELISSLEDKIKLFPDILQNTAVSSYVARGYIYTVNKIKDMTGWDKEDCVNFTDDIIYRFQLKKGR